MKNLVVLGIVLMALGAGLMIFRTISWREKHEASIFGAEMSVTTKEQRRIPYVVSGTLLVVGAAVTVIGATKRKG
jgi:hypothetical protein